MFEVPNLDDFSHEPKDQLEAARVFKILAIYCQNKALAMQERLEGDIQSAIVLEKANEKRYNSLPEWAKW